MRLPGSAMRGIASVFLFSVVLWLNPLFVEPWTQGEHPPFDPSHFRVCVELCRVVVLTCQVECQMGGSPPEFSPGDCMSHCNQVGNACRQEACTHLPEALLLQ